jgi:hypothetical protein
MGGTVFITFKRYETMAKKGNQSGFVGPLNCVFEFVRSLTTDERWQEGAGAIHPGDAGKSKGAGQ